MGNPSRPWSLRAAPDEQIFEMMVGHGKASGTTRHAAARSTQAIVEVKDLTTSKLRDVSFAIGAGEVLGVAALDGQGQRSLFYAWLAWKSGSPEL